MPDMSWDEVRSCHVWHAVCNLSMQLTCYGMQYVSEPKAIPPTGYAMCSQNKGVSEQIICSCSRAGNT